MSLPRASLLLAFCASLAACATTGEPPSRTPASSIPANGGSAVAIGKSTKADVISAYGKTVEIDFDSGYAVWVYRLGTAEFVLLFDPAGVLKKTRTR
ncbi:MAG: hypothetical protein JSS40_01250 [Proteobacteria bacterium]|nr:hypothetical protein [Pseudomonadota bacterium]